MATRALHSIYLSEQLCKNFIQCKFMQSFNKFGQVVKEELFKEIVDTQMDGRKQAHMHGRAMDDGQWAITKAHIENIVLR